MVMSQSIFSILLACLLASGGVWWPKSTQTQETQLLTPGPSLERALAGGESQVYPLKLAAGQYLRVTVEQHGIDVVVALFGPDGQKLAEAGHPISSVEVVSLIAATAGEFRLEVRSPNPANAAGRYELKLEVRDATAQDRDRVAAERAFQAGERLRNQATDETRRSALGKYEEALALYRAVADRRGEAFTLHGLGLIHYWLGDRRKSLAHHQQALPLLQDVADRKAEAWTTIELGTLYNLLGEKQPALERLNRALTLLRALGERSLEAYTLANLGLVYGSMDEHEQSIAYYQQALALQRSRGERQGEASSLAALGGNYEALGQKQKALEYLLQALPLLHELRNGQGEAQTLYTIGMIYDSLNERAKAVEYFNRALVLRKAVGHRRGKATLLWSLGNIYDGLDDKPQALTHFQQALVLFEAAKDYVAIATMLRNIGLAYDALGEKQKAVEHFKRALPLFRLGPNRQAQARLLVNLGKVLSETGEHQQALEHLNEALSLLRRFNHRFFEVQTLYYIARSERARGNLTAARARIEEALGLIENIRTTFYEPELRVSGLARAQDYYELEMDLLVRLGESQADQKLIAAALETSEQARARSLLDLLAESRIEIRQGLTPELKEREQATQSRLSTIQSQLIQIRQQANPDAGRLAALQEELKRADAEREQLEREIRRQYPRYAELRYPTPLRAEAIRGLLDEQTALLEYTLGQENSFLFVVTREGLHCRRLPPAAEINRLVQEVRETLGQPGRSDFANYTRAASRLYDLLLAPVAAVLTAKRKLLIVPDGALYYLPFESLPAKVAGQSAADYLLKQWTISYVPSGSVLASLRQNTRPAADKPLKPGSLAPKHFLAFADPVYQPGETVAEVEKPTAPESSATLALRNIFDQEGRWELPRLAESNREATGIARLYRPEQTALYLGQEAREENVKGNAALATARRIHFATHGLISTNHPQHSGLVLTLDADPREDGLLQVWEIFNLKLQAELVVLSACRTGLGQEVRGEGILGLTRAFMYAGAPSVVVSLWRVADRSTAELMIKFYQHLDRTADKAEALRQAKLELMRNPRYASPYYWAPFVLIGEPK
jgi:CHAT domain-containing protein/Tfp pilus assembly protein PilF